MRTALSIASAAPVERAHDLHERYADAGERRPSLLELPAHCANIGCPNTSHHRGFTLVEAEASQVFNARPLRLWMCAVCASALRGLFADADVTSSSQSA